MRTIFIALLALSLSACASGGAGRGAASIGDSYFPGLGNGGYDVQHYELQLRIDPRDNQLQGTAVLDVVATEELSRFDLDLWKLTVESVAVNGVDADFERQGLELIITPATALHTGEAFTVAVVYGGEPQPVPSAALPMMDGMGWLRHGENIYVVSEPNGAASFVPCNDHPRDKASWSLQIDVPAPWVAVSNGVPGEMVESDGWRRYSWVADDPMASYLLTLAIAPFELEQTRLRRDFAVRNYWLPELAEKAREGLARTAEILEFYSESFGAYPFGSYGAIVTDAPIPGALETQTIPIYGMGTVNESTLAHEMAHQWFGDCVSVSDWKDIWLNEGFATYASLLWQRHDQGQQAFDERMEKISGPASEGRFGPAVDPGVEELFSPGVYVGGAWALHQLHQAVGDETFFEILRTWVARHHFGNASTEQFIDLASEVSGADQGPLLERWLSREKSAAPDA